MADSLVRVGRIISPHGIKGEVKLSAFTDDATALAGYGTLYNHDRSRNFVIKKIRAAKDSAIAVLEGVNNRNDAEKLKGIELYAKTSAMPELDNDSLYAFELVGMSVSAPTGEAIGIVSGLYDFGGGDVIEIDDGKGGSEMYPFNDNTVVMIDRAERKVIFSIPHME